MQTKAPWASESPSLAATSESGILFSPLRPLLCDTATQWNEAQASYGCDARLADQVGHPRRQDQEKSFVHSKRNVAT